MMNDALEHLVEEAMRAGLVTVEVTCDACGWTAQAPVQGFGDIPRATEQAKEMWGAHDCAGPSNPPGEEATGSSREDHERTSEG